MKNWQRIARVSLPMLLAFGLAACGNSDATTSSGDASAAAASAPEPVTTPPTKINVTTPLAKPPAAGKTLFWLQCELPICEKIGGGVKAATEAAGWNYESLVFKSADPGAGIESAVQQKPDVIAITGIPSAAIKSQLKAAAEAGIPVVTCAPGPEEPSAETYAAICSQTTAPDGKNLALWAIKDSGGDGKHRDRDDPGLPLAGDHGRRHQRHRERVLPRLFHRRARADRRRPGRRTGGPEARRLPAVEPRHQLRAVQLRRPRDRSARGPQSGGFWTR